MKQIPSYYELVLELIETINTCKRGGNNVPEYMRMKLDAIKMLIDIKCLIDEEIDENWKNDQGTHEEEE